MSFLQDMDPNLLRFLASLGLVIIVIFVGRWLANHIRVWLSSSLQRTDLTESFVTLLITLSYFTVLIITGMLALALLGVPSSTIVGIVGIVVVVLAIALQQSLGNLTATVMFLLFKPFQVGHIIQTAGILGVVQEIQLFSVVLVSGDHKTHVLPGSMIQASGLTNFSKIGSIRVDLSFGVAYDSDISKAKEIILNLLQDNERVLQEPAPQVFVQNLGDSSVDIAARPFVNIADFFPFQMEVTEQVKERLDAAGIEIPYPHQDVRLLNNG